MLKPELSEPESFEKCSQMFDGKTIKDVEMKKTMSTQMKKSFTELEMKPNFSKDVSSKNEESNFCDKFVVFFELVNKIN